MKDSPLTSDQELALLHDISGFYADIFGFVMYAFPWGVPGGPLEDHEGPDEWQISQHLYIENQILNNPLGRIMDATASGHGVGKGHPVTTAAKKVIVSASNSLEADTIQDVNWGDLRVGDYVFGQDGQPTRITATNRYRREHYRVTFDDGTSTVVSGEHEWNVRGRQERRKGLPGWRTLETREILKVGVKRSNGTAMARQWEIPTCEPVQFAHTPVYDPYTVGVWLGDGSSTSACIGSTRDEIWSRIGISPNRDTLAYKRNGMMLANPPGLNEALKSLGMIPVTCDTKFIPDAYKYNSESVRRDLVSGMLDTDGEVNKSGSIGYSSTSLRLVEDLMWMVRSLGGKASLQPTTKKTSYVKNGVRSAACKPLHRCTINFGGVWNPFTHTYKRDLVSDEVQSRYTTRWIDSIESVGMADGMCITVEAEDHLYLANDFIVTHNSAEVAWIILWAMSTRPHLNGVVTANTFPQLNTKTWRELALWHKRAINAHWFEWTAKKFFHKQHPETWSVSPIANSEHNSEAFAGQHGTHSLVIYDEACHDDKTEVLTDQGWRLFSDLDGSELMLTRNPDTQESEWLRPTKLFKAHRKGEMFLYDAARGGNFCVTPNHQMFFKTYAHRREDRRSDWKKAEIQTLSRANHFIPRHIEWSTPNVNRMVIEPLTTTRKSYPGRSLDMSQWCEFLGWYVSEGHTIKQHQTGGTEVVGFGISQRPGADLNRIVELFESLGISFSLACNQSGVVQVLSHDRLISNHLGKYGLTCLDKRVPREVMSCSVDQIGTFLDAFVKGDGYRHENRDTLYTSSEGLAGDLQELILREGKNSTVVRRPLEGVTSDFGTHIATSSCDGYVVSRSDTKSDLCFAWDRVKRIDYDGMVYCAEVPPNHLLFTRREGHAMWSGNSAIPDVIWEVSSGVNDPRAMWFVFGNPTKNTGRFKECWGRFRDQWNTRQVDSRTCRMPNKESIQKDVDAWGEDSDFVRVRVKGEFPRVGDTQFISTEVVEKAILREIEVPYGTPKLLGVDVARFGSDQTVICRRQGRKVEPLIKLRGLDTMQVAARVAEEIVKNHIDVTFVDGVGLGAGVVDRLRQLGFPCVEVLSGSTPDAENKDTAFNKRAEMWMRMREWLVGADLPDDTELRDDLTGIEYFFDTKQRIQMERKEDMKKRGLHSPDCADAVALTFAQLTPVAKMDYNRADLEPEALEDF